MRERPMPETPPGFDRKVPSPVDPDLLVWTPPDLIDIERYDDAEIEPCRHPKAVDGVCVKLPNAECWTTCTWGAPDA